VNWNGITIKAKISIVKIALKELREILDKQKNSR
jgi:hypothetical protein